MKRTIKNLALILMLVVAFTCVAMQASAADASALTFTACEGGVMVSGCNTSADGELAIPAEYNGSKVVAIGDGAFNNCVKLTSVAIPEGVKVIGESAFEGCKALSAVDLPESLTTISSYAFFGCDSLKTVALYPNTTNIASYAFYDCAIEKIALPKGIAVIKEGTFGECAALKSIFIPNTVKTVELSAFAGCSKVESVFYEASSNMWYGITWYEDNDALYLAKKDVVKYSHVHSYTTKVTTEPTCTVKGKATNTCECGIVYKGEVAVLGHSAEKIPEVKATCTEAGKTAGEKCSRCGEIITQPGVIPATGHKTVVDQAVPATCTATGLTKGEHCDFCGEVFVKQETVEMLGHEFNYENLEKATTTNNGSRKGTCKVCGYQADEVLYNVSVFELSTSKCTYNGKKRTPTVTVKDSAGNKLIEGRDYTVSYADGRKNPGVYAIKVTLQGEYDGSNTLKFTITPGKTDKIKATASKTNAVKLSWEEVKGATGYRVYIYETAKGKTRVKVASVETNSYTLKKDYAGKSLKMGTTYKVAVTAYTKSSGTTIHADKGTALTFKFAPSAPTLKVTSTSKGKATISWSDVPGETGYQVYYSADNKEFTKLASYKGWPDAQTKSGLKSGKTYYFKVRAYTKVDGKTIYGAFSDVKSVKIK